MKSLLEVDVSDNYDDTEKIRQPRRYQRHYSDHIEISKRVIDTVTNNPTWHANGLPDTSGSSARWLQTNTVALASLKASIENISREIE